MKFTEFIVGLVTTIIKGDALFNQPVNNRTAPADTEFHCGGVTQSGPGGQGVLHMSGIGIPVVQHSGHAALGPKS